jgi:hypothetical protein
MTLPDTYMSWGLIVGQVVAWVTYEKKERGELMEDMVGKY